MNTDGIHELEIQLRDAKIALAIQKHEGARREFGICPYERGHFDLTSFLFALALGVASGSMIGTLVVHIGGCK